MKIFLIINTGYSLQLFANSDRYFTVNKFAGHAYYLPPWEIVWLEVEEGIQIPEYSLLRLYKKSAIELTYNKDEISGRSILLSFPLILRLDGNMVRDITTRDVYLSDHLRDILLKQKKESDKKKVIYLYWDEVWRRVAALVYHLPGVSDYFKKIIEQGEIPSFNLKKIKPIQIIYPYSYSIFPVERFPHNITIHWKKPDATTKIKYNVYFWSATENQSSPIEITTHSQVTLPIFNEGEYLLQIRSDDGLYHSSIHTLKVFLRSNLVKYKFLGFMKKIDKEPIQLIFPNDNSFIFTPNPKIKVTFCWKNVAKPFGSNYLFSIKRVNSKKAKIIPTSNVCVDKILKVGEFEWSVSVVDFKKDEFKVIEKSKTREIVVSNRTNNLDNIVRFYLRQSNGKIILY